MAQWLSYQQLIAEAGLSFLQKKWRTASAIAKTGGRTGSRVDVMRYLDAQKYFT